MLRYKRKNTKILKKMLFLFSLTCAEWCHSYQKYWCVCAYWLRKDNTYWTALVLHWQDKPYAWGLWIIKNTWFLYYFLQLWVEIVSPLSKLCSCWPISTAKKEIIEHWNQAGCCFLKCKILAHRRWCLSITLLIMLF